MNAINHPDVQAIHATASAAPAVQLEAADPSKNLILVPLSRLVSRPTGRNLRKTPRMSIPELAASIQRVGLLQNLFVTATSDGERYEVVAEGRPIEEIGADSCVTPLVMQRRLKLANVLPRPVSRLKAKTPLCRLRSGGKEAAHKSPCAQKPLKPCKCSGARAADISSALRRNERRLWGYSPVCYDRLHESLLSSTLAVRCLYVTKDG